MKIALPLLLSAALLSGCQKKSVEVAGVVTPASQAAQPARAPQGADLIRINGQGFTQADVDFAGLMLRLQVLSQEATPTEQAAALKRTENVNVRLNHLIERYAMSLLGAEKHYAIPEAQIDAERTKLQAQIDAHPEMGKAIADYGTDAFTGRLREYLRQQAIRTRIIQDLLAAERRKNPHASAKELDYNTAQAYDALYQDHMDDLSVQINLKGLPPRTEAERAPATPAPALNVKDAAGKPYPLPRPTAKRPLLLNFWATWCGPCREELPLLLQAKAAGKYDVLLVNVGEGPEKVQAYLKAQHLEGLPVAYASQTELSGWNIPGLPSSFLIGPGWTKVDQHFGPLKAGEGWLGGI